MKKMKVWSTVLATGVALTTLAACSGGSNSTTASSSEEKADKSQELVIYSNSVSNGRGDWLTAKAKEAGFNIKMVDIPGAQLADRVIAEKNNAVADMVFGIGAVDSNKIRDQKLEGSQVDLYKLVEDYNSNYVPENTGGIEEINGKDYLPIKVYKLDSRNSKARKLWLNLETKKIEWEDGKLQEYPEKIPSVKLGVLKKHLEEATTSLTATTVYDVLYQNQLSFYPNVLKGSILEESDPKAYQLLRKKDSQLYILLDAELYYNVVFGNVQEFINLYQLFVPANTNLYEGITIPAELSKDGQVHQVNTKEEFEAYFDVEKGIALNKGSQVLVEEDNKGG